MIVFNISTVRGNFYFVAKYIYVLTCFSNVKYWILKFTSDVIYFKKEFTVSSRNPKEINLRKT